MSMQALTDVQKNVLSFIMKCQKEQGSPPTVREIAQHFGYKSVNNARQHLRLIERKGYIRLFPGKARGIALAIGLEEDRGRNAKKVPLVGAVAAGKPITAIENIEDYITLDKNMFKGSGIFSLRVKGDSMTGIGILDGDIAIIRQQPSAEANDIVVAIIDGEATLKRYIKQNGAIIFRAENPHYSDITFPPDKGDEVQIAGKLIGVMRKV
ncbi:MAG: transcriptional repressor LexA [bacterium]